MTIIWNAASRVNFKHADTTEVHNFEFVITHDDLYSENCPLCVFSRGHLGRLFDFLDDAWFVERDSQSPDPTKTIWCMTGDMTAPELISNLVDNFEGTLRAAHVKTIAYRDMLTGTRGVYTVQTGEFT